MKQIILRCLNRLGFFCNRYLKACYKYDYSKFSSFGGIGELNSTIIASEIRIIVHTIEKAFSLSDCRDDFGKEKIINLTNLYEKCDAKTFADQDALEICRSIVNKYYLHRIDKGLDTSFIPLKFRNIECKKNVGATAFKLLEASHDFQQIALARHSIRNYKDVVVRNEDIVEAVKIAQTAPSACNRQATRVYACVADDKIAAIKKAHGGIRTFGKPGVIFAISQDLTMYLNEYERNTWLIDAGIFCMNMLYALQSVGVVACPVIWGGMKDEDERIAKLLGIPENERVAILIVGGYPLDDCKTPCSTKRPIGDILSIVI